MPILYKFLLNLSGIFGCFKYIPVDIMIMIMIITIVADGILFPVNPLNHYVGK